MGKTEKNKIDRELDSLERKVVGGGEKKSDLVFDPKRMSKCEKGHTFITKIGICNACRFGKHITND